MLPRVRSVSPLDHYSIELTFSDGTQGVLDLRDWIIGQGELFQPLESPEFFQAGLCQPGFRHDRLAQRRGFLCRRFVRPADRNSRAAGSKLT